MRVLKQTGNRRCQCRIQSTQEILETHTHHCGSELDDRHRLRTTEMKVEKKDVLEVEKLELKTGQSYGPKSVIP